MSKTKNSKIGADDFDPEILKKFKITGQYGRRIEQLKEDKFFTDSIEKTVTSSMNKIKSPINSFVIFGDPQSGKTEMMIELTLKLLDEGFKMIIILITDNVYLLIQNLERFKKASLNPSPKNYKEILDKHVKIGTNPWVIFCKKNSKDLQKLIKKLGKSSKRIVIDDEADFATPNSKINLKNEKSRINELTGKLIGKNGIWMGVTATPARIDLNNTHRNDNTEWVKFEAHPQYTGADSFFPVDQKSVNYVLTLLPDDNLEHLKDALFNFLIRAAFLNISPEIKKSNYSMVVHTSGKVDDHTKDYQMVTEILGALSNKRSTYWKAYYALIWDKAKKMFPGKEMDISKYIVENINRRDVIVMNSKKDFEKIGSGPPINPFTIVIGGNIISRGVTFDNLISMFFTRGVKGSFHQDTYIQRARMFGSRKEYLKYFELTIPKELYLTWHQCFILHRLSLDSIEEGNKPPIWVFDGKVKTTSPSSIDRNTVIMHSGEMGFGIFDYTDAINKIIVSKDRELVKLQNLKEHLDKIDNAAFPEFIYRYVMKSASGEDSSVGVHNPMDISGWRDVDKKVITRPRGFISSTSQKQKKFASASHHIQIVYNKKTKKARLVYKPLSNNLGFLTNP